MKAVVFCLGLLGLTLYATQPVAPGPLPTTSSTPTAAQMAAARIAATEVAAQEAREAARLNPGRDQYSDSDAGTGSRVGRTTTARYYNGYESSGQTNVPIWNTTRVQNAVSTPVPVTTIRVNTPPGLRSQVGYGVSIAR